MDSFDQRQMSGFQRLGSSKDAKEFAEALERFKAMPAATEQQQPLTEAEKFLKDYPDQYVTVTGDPSLPDGYEHLQAHPEATFRAMFNSLGIPKISRLCNFDNFKTPDESYKLLSRAVLGWAKTLGKDSFGATSLVLVGPTGCGKTHLAVAATKWLVRGGYNPRYYMWRELIEDLKDNDSHKTYSYDPEPIIIDDIGAASIKLQEYRLERIQLIFHIRLENQYPMILTTNLDWPDGLIDKSILDQRLLSRLRKFSQVHNIKLDDWRTKPKNTDWISASEETLDANDNLPF